MAIPCTCAAPHPHTHGPCRLCAFYAPHRPGDAVWFDRPTCLHPTMWEVQTSKAGRTYTAWGDVSVRNGAGQCPTFRPIEGGLS